MPGEARPGRSGARTSASASGARCARTTAPHGNAWDYFPHDHARSRAYRWGEDGIAGISRRPAAALPRAGAVERPRPDPEGAPLRPDQRRGQPRRGREGALLLPRRHADALVPEDALQVSAARVPLRASWSRRTAAAARREPEFELLDTGVFDDDRYFDVFVEYAKAAPDDMLMRVTVHNRGPGSRAAAPAAAALVPQHLVLEARQRRSRRCDVDERGAIEADASGRSARIVLLRRRRTPRAAVLRQRDQRRAAVRHARRARLLQGRLPRVRRRRRRDAVNPAADRHEGRGAATRSTFRPAAASTVRAAADARRARTHAVRRLRRDLRRAASREADEFYADAAAGHRPTPTRGSCSARRSPA